MKRLMLSAVLFLGFAGARIFVFVKTVKRIPVRIWILSALLFWGIVSLNAQCVEASGVSITAPTEPDTHTVIKKMDTSGNLPIPDQSILFSAGIITGSPVTYEWYVNGILQLDVTGNTFTYITPTVEGVYTVYAAAENACTQRNTERSAEITVMVTKDVEPPLPPFRLFYSEANTTYGATTPYVPVNAIAGPVNASASFSIDLTVPIGEPTARFFNTYDATITAASNQVWGISQVQTSVGAAAALTTNAATPAAYGGAPVAGIRLELPAGYEGVVTLTCGGAYTIKLNVAARGISSAVKVGETFTAGGVEWRLLAKNFDGSNALVMAEKIQFNCWLHDSGTNWDTGIRWAGSRLRNILNGIAVALPSTEELVAAAWYSARMSDAAFADAINTTALKTKNGVNGPGYDASLTAEAFFLLSEDEVCNTSSGGNITNNLFVGESLMADEHARKAATYGSGTSWWCRSPRSNAGYAAIVLRTTGAANSVTVANSTGGVRPAVCLNLNK